MDCHRAKTLDPDDWLEDAPDFSRPIVAELRDWIFRDAPDLRESIKWNMLCFSGRKLVCGLSACKKHVGIAFFRGTELADPARLFPEADAGNTNIRSIRITTPGQLPRRAFTALLLAAVALDSTPDILPAPKVKREPWPMPEFFAEALKKHPRAAAGFAAFAPTYQPRISGLADRGQTRRNPRPTSGANPGRPGGGKKMARSKATMNAGGWSVGEASSSSNRRGSWMVFSGRRPSHNLAQGKRGTSAALGSR